MHAEYKSCLGVVEASSLDATSGVLDAVEVPPEFCSVKTSWLRWRMGSRSPNGPSTPNVVLSLSAKIADRKMRFFGRSNLNCFLHNLISDLPIPNACLPPA
jgi:hypothetical protein